MPSQSLMFLPQVNELKLTSTLFDRDVAKIVKVSAKVLLEKYQRGELAKAYPIELDELIGKSLACIIYITIYNFERNCDNYGVDRLSNGPSVISHLETKLEDEQVRR